jgi:O-antigen ligase
MAREGIPVAELTAVRAETRAETGTHGGAAVPLLLAALSGGLLAQGAFYPRGQWYVGVLLAAAALVVLAAHPVTRTDVLAPPVLAGAALAAWAVADGAVHGTGGASHSGGAGLRYALLLAGLLAVAYTCRCLPEAARPVVLAGLVAVGCVVAATGWVGVLLRRDGWAWQAQRLWRAAATLTYPNAAAAVLAMLALASLAQLAYRPDSIRYALAATGLLAGLGATLSRAGLLALVVGLGVLAVAVGPRRLLAAARGPALGALVAVAGLLPSMPAGSPAKPVVAVAALVAGLGVGALLARAVPTRWLLGGLPVLLAVLAFAAGPLAPALHAVGGARATLDSPDRGAALRAAWQIVTAHPLAGGGPGLPRLTTGASTGGIGIFRYVHNEYLQVLAELGIPGLLLLLALLIAVGRALYRARSTAQPAYWAAAAAACAALAVHAGLDFLWHLPAIPLLAAALVGLATPERPARPIAVHSERGNQ